VKVLDGEGYGEYFDIAEGIDYAANFSQDGKNPVKVINLSLGGEPDDYSETLKRAIDGAVAKGILVVVASGNESGAVSFPGNLDKAFTVGAVDGRKQRAWYSNFGKQVDVVAPGGDCDRDDDNDGYGDCVFQQTFDPDALEVGRYDTFCYCGFDGTSMAAPHVSAAAALLYAQGITDPAAVRAVLQQTADPLTGKAGERTDDFGFGLIQPVQALSGLGFNLGFPKK
jgi:serine protease